MVAEHPRTAIAETPVEIKASTNPATLRLTVFPGVAVLAGKEESLGKLVARADGALNQARGAGRNCVVMAENPG